MCFLSCNCGNSSASSDFTNVTMPYSYGGNTYQYVWKGYGAISFFNDTARNYYNYGSTKVINSSHVQTDWPNYVFIWPSANYYEPTSFIVFHCPAGYDFSACDSSPDTGNGNQVMSGNITDTGHVANFDVYSNDGSTKVFFANYTAPPLQITVILNPQAGGIVAGMPGILSCTSGVCTGSFSGNETLTATASDGWTFAYWDDGTNRYTNNQQVFNINVNKNIKAVFKLLSFPLAGYNSLNAPVSSVFDHSATAEYTSDTDNHVTAFNGESSDNATYYPMTTCYAKDSSHNFAFGAGFNYAGVTSLGGVNYLCYDGHPAYDYPIAIGTDVYPAASGTVITIVSGETEENKQTPAGNYVEIEHTGGYKTKYLHLHSVDANNVQLNQYIQPSVRLGTSGCTGTLCGGPHLHFQVNKVVDGNNTPVDPYGWTGTGDDLYTRATNYNLWK
jgi:murein DD-endopeptidase MepM/ murein hydrolase activator NlpD